jgi:hypothetical protein
MKCFVSGGLPPLKQLTVKMINIIQEKVNVQSDTLFFVWMILNVTERELQTGSADWCTILSL